MVVLIPLAAITVFWMGGWREFPLVILLVAFGIAQAIALLRPAPFLMLVHAALTAALAAYFALPVIESRRPLHLGRGGNLMMVLLMLFLSVPWIRHYLRHRRVATVVPTPEVVAWLESCLRRLSRSTGQTDPNVIRADAFVPIVFSVAVGELLPDVSVWAVDGQHLRFVARGDLEIEQRRPGGPGHPHGVRVRFGPGARPVRATMSAEHLARYERWRQSAASAA